MRIFGVANMRILWRGLVGGFGEGGLVGEVRDTLQLYHARVKVVI
jgi:hypothetical protein